MLNVVPTTFFTGSRLSFNKYTDKLFYSTGAKIYQIGDKYNNVPDLYTSLEDAFTVDINFYSSTRYIICSLLAGHDDTQILTLHIPKVDLSLLPVTVAKDIIVRIDNLSSSNAAKIKVVADQDVSLKNMFNGDLTTSGLAIAAGNTMEVVFTFWGPNDVTFNGGERIW